MEETFENRPLLDRDFLRTLQKRKNLPSLIHLTLHLGAFALCIGLSVYTSPFPLAAVFAAGLLGAVWTTLFAPFHECAHQTAFRSCRLNTIGAWLTGILKRPGTCRRCHLCQLADHAAGVGLYGRRFVAAAAQSSTDVPTCVLGDLARGIGATLRRYRSADKVHLGVPRSGIGMGRSGGPSVVRGARCWMGTSGADPVPRLSGDLADGGAYRFASPRKHPGPHAHHAHFGVRELVAVEYELSR